MGRQLKDPSFRTVTKWAKKKFPNNFSAIPTKKEFNIQRHRLLDFRSNAQFKCVVIGTIKEEEQNVHRTPVEVIAWYEGRRVVTGRLPQPGGELRPTVYEGIADKSIHFNEPFSSIINAGGETAVPRLEALIRYYFLSTRSGAALQGKGQLTKFEKHFPGACHDVANVPKMRHAERQPMTAPLELASEAHMELGESSEDNAPEVFQSEIDHVAMEPPPAESISQAATTSISADMSIETPLTHNYVSRTSSSVATLSIQQPCTLRSVDLREDSITSEVSQRRITRSQTARQTVSVPEPDPPTSLPQQSISLNDGAIPTTTARVPTHAGPLQVQLGRMSSDYTRFKISLAARLNATQAKTQKLENELILIESEKNKMQQEVTAWKDKHALLNFELEHQRDEAKTWKEKHTLLSTEAEELRKEVTTWKDKHSVTSMELESQRTEASEWKSRHGAVTGQLSQAREAEEAWKARYLALKTTLSDVFSAQI